MEAVVGAGHQPSYLACLVEGEVADHQIQAAAGVEGDRL